MKDRKTAGADKAKTHPATDAQAWARLVFALNGTMDYHRNPLGDEEPITFRVPPGTPLEDLVALKKQWPGAVFKPLEKWADFGIGTRAKMEAKGVALFRWMLWGASPVPLALDAQTLFKDLCAFDDVLERCGFVGGGDGPSKARTPAFFSHFHDLRDLLEEWGCGECPVWTVEEDAGERVKDACMMLLGMAQADGLAEAVGELARMEAAAELAAAEARAARAEAEAAEARGDTEAKAKAKAKAARYEARAEAARKRLERLKAAGGVDMVGQVLLEGKTLSTLTRERGLDRKTVRKNYRVQTAIVVETVQRALPVALEALRKEGEVPPATLDAMKAWAAKIPGAIAEVLTPKRGRPSRPDAMHKRTPQEGTARTRAAMNGNAGALDEELFHGARDNAGFGGVDYTPPDLEEDGWEGDGAALGDDEDGTGDSLTAEERAAARWGSVGPDVYGKDD